MKNDAWYIIDEDEQEIIGFYIGTEAEVKKVLEELKDARAPGSDNYWNTWSLFKRVAV